MNMKTTPNDVSNQEILLELRKHTERFDRIESKFEHIYSRFEHIDSRFEQMDSKFGKLEATQQQILEAINEESTENARRFAAMDERFDRLEDRFVTKSQLLNAVGKV